MEYKDEKAALYRELVLAGANEKESAKVARHCTVPAELVQAWINRFYSTTRRVPIYVDTPRLVNASKLGADPEFMLATKPPQGQQLKYLSAQNSGLETMRAFGSDMSGRQAELRAYPDRSALRVVASLVDTLRYMALSTVGTEWQWLAPAMWITENGRYDGFGGHIHLGRRRPDRESNVMGLDIITNALITGECVDKSGALHRRGHTAYGKYGDWRSQEHGFEYRTMPTWLDSPWSAFLTLTLCKLVPRFWTEGTTTLINKKPMALEFMHNLLRMYANLDDDAALALWSWDNFGPPKYSSEDFQTKWGAFLAITPSYFHMYYPSVIKPSEITCREVYWYLRQRAAIPNQAPIGDPTWTPTELPAGFSVLSINPHVYGTAEIGQGLVSKYAVFLGASAGQVPSLCLDVLEGLRLDLRTIRAAYTRISSIEGPLKLILRKPGDSKYDIRIMLQYSGHRPEPILTSEVRRFLVDSGLFPIVRVTEIDRLSEWCTAKPLVNKLVGQLDTCESKGYL
jgi:hypothetical protein